MRGRTWQAQLLLVALLLSACQQGGPAGPSPLAIDPADQSLPSEFTGQDPTPDGPSTGWPDTDSEQAGSPDPTADPTPSATSPSPTPWPTTSPSPSPSSSPSPSPTTSPSPSPSPTASPSPGPSPTAGGCPDARTCAEYDLLGGRWPAGPDGTVTIRYRIRTDGWVADPTGVREAPAADEMVAMIRAAAQTWMDANPRLRLIYDGVTTEEPANGNNVIGWGSSPQNTGIARASAHLTPNRSGPTYTGFHVIMERTQNWSWDPCDPENGPPCSDDPNAAPDFQGTVAHEWGHVLGLEHPCWDGRCDPSELTMSVHGERSMRTLGLGDVLGVRALYPTDAPMPTIHRP